MPKYTPEEQQEAIKKIVDLVNEYHLTIVTEQQIQILAVPFEEGKNE